MDGIHGGDIYRNKVQMDFSVNTNPLGMPEGVREALSAAVGQCHTYPDMEAVRLKQAVSGMLSVPAGHLLFGNGASELFMGILHAIRPKNVLLPVPSFYGYEYAAEAAFSRIRYFFYKKEDGFLPGSDLLDELTEGTDLLFLANPNNPTGRLSDRAYLEKLLQLCRDRGIYVVLDECFVEFCGEGASMIRETEVYPNLLLVRAFTKIFAIPGVRLGYLVCSDEELLQRVKRQLPEWNLSTFAQKAGIACAGQAAYVEKTVEYVKKEREFLAAELEKKGLLVFPGEANFLLVFSEKPLYEALLKRKILIRDCGNFRGLSAGYYRIAVRTRKENELLLKEIGECFGEDRKSVAGRN